MINNILVVDDEPSIIELLEFNLQKAGYHVLKAENGHEALQLVRANKPDLIILDLMIPGIDGIEVCRRLKGQQETAGIPIIMLTARNEEVDKIVGLELGADDYMTKPFSPRELMARIKAVLRRSHKDSAQHDGELVIGKLRLNFSSYTAYLDQEKLELTPKEYELLKLFITNVGRAYTREQLLEKVWGYEYFGDTRTVDVHVRHLRAKMAAEPKVAEAIETVRGVGYRFSEI
ncbi:response regulator [Pelosinus propionicus]|uniref:Two-component system, OmpR family, alkaline phosphatase synthesis response regulator PhoP n=1 Tax=Pelosinus propionicus DSM 13327 TaxID=1123291 RepID=A0A1I4LDC0_9FIRM|nr:response regulator transcription factor [Pelosinus propionicus]SFL88856.1 two-component system, OmpR family, alkaline phosphatase synthesis response regulator PhoP [Pelosinus propionicus DSM 13327]